MRHIKLVPVLGASGVGKNFLIDELVRRYPDQFMAPRQYSTREMREGEIDGNPYRFIGDIDFAELKPRLTAVTGQYGANYGSSKSQVFDPNSNKIVLINIDMQGWLSLMSHIHEHNTEGTCVHVLNLGILSTPATVREGREELDLHTNLNVQSFADIVLYPWKEDYLRGTAVDSRLLQYCKANDNLRVANKRLVSTTERVDDFDEIIDIILNLFGKKVINHKCLQD